MNWIALPVSAVFLFFAVRLLIADRTMAIVQADLAALKPRDAAIAYERARRWGITADLWYSRQSSVTASRALDPVTALLAYGNCQLESRSPRDDIRGGSAQCVVSNGLALRSSAKQFGAYRALSSGGDRQFP